MALDLHTISVIGASDPLVFSDRLHFAKITVPYAAGGGAGAAVTTAVAATLPAGSALAVANVPAGVAASVVQTATGFTVTTTPISSGATLGAGSLVVLLFG